MSKRLERKPLSFSTTMRNPERIAEFLETIIEFEGEVLTNDLIEKILKKWLVQKLYRPDSILKNNPTLKEKFYDEFQIFSETDVDYIYTELPKVTKGHKEAGFDRGWPSRFDTYMSLPMELGFLYYQIGLPLEISQTGKLLVKSNRNLAEGEKVVQVTNISDIFLNSLVKYQTNNPFRRNIIDNAPFVLFLRTVKVLKEKYLWEVTGVYRHEVPFVICWPDANANSLAKFITDFRSNFGKTVSDEIVYEKCLELLESENRKRFKFKQITKEGPDDFIRKLRITGLVSLRGGGRLIDINRFELDRINYIIETYSIYKTFETTHDYYKYMGKIDNTLIETHTVIPENEIIDIRQRNLLSWSRELSTAEISKELKALTHKNGSLHPVLKFISGPTRFEFLMSIALKHRYPSLDIKPNYPIDDEGMPTFTARGGMGDIEVFGENEDVLVEVTLMRDKSQSTHEIPGITRHVNEFRENKEKMVFSLFVAPSIHVDTMYMIDFSKSQYDVNIYPFTIDEFIVKYKSSIKITDLIQ